MEAMIERCAGLDVHQETVVACVLFGPLEKKPKTSIETFSTTTTGLLALSDRLAALQVFYVVMESTGVYWKPIWNILEGSYHLVLARNTVFVISYGFKINSSSSSVKISYCRHNSRTNLPFRMASHAIRAATSYPI
ncbi:hypothetical protein OKW24_005206 [Peribacillus simplex]|nr:hypothetical protein [Peribacillus simplex]